MKFKKWARIIIFVVLLLLATVINPLYVFLSQETNTVPVVTAGMLPKPKFQFHVASGLREPLGVAVDARGYLYIADSGNNQVKVYEPNGNLIKIFGEKPDETLRFNYPNAITVDHNGIICVGELKQGRIQIFDFDAKVIKTIDANTSGLPLAPLALTFGGDGQIYVANHTGEVFIINQEGQTLMRFGEPGSQPGQLSYPNGIVVDTDGRIIVSDSGNARIQIFDKEGNFNFSFSSMEFGVSMPRGIALSAGNHLYIADIFGHQAVELDEKLKRLYSFGGLGQQEGELKFPNGVAVNNKGEIYVVERGNNRVSVFGR